MSKIRIYELARELGVDNKVVIDKAIEVGVPGKISHSNSLSSDEADQIRRAVIRQAIGSSPEKQTLTTRVDKISGATESIVEKRKGNVIRRRKATAEDLGSDTEGKVGRPISDNGLEVAPDPVVVAEDAVEQSDLVPEEDQADNLSGVATPSNRDLVEDTTVATTTDESAVRQVVQERSVEAEPESTANRVSSVSAEEKKGIGPKVLGRIELPQKRIKPEPARGPAPVMELVRTPEEASDEEEGDGRRGVGRRKTKKREFSRGDLIDYEGRDGRVRSRPKSAQKSRTDGDDKRFAVDPLALKASKRVVKMNEFITVGEFAKQLSLKSAEVIAKLMKLGVMATINQSIDQDTATILADEFGYQVESTSFDESAALDTAAPESAENMQPRAPVVTVMGHVDHGKTSLLDTIRKASVAAKEHGGITQHIGAYRVVLPDSRSLTFIDTPGHAAFTSMRARGAQVTDIVVLVVAVDDGVMPQTLEAINHAKAAKVPIVVAVNKIDKPGTNVERIKQQLVEHGLQPEDWGGDTMYFPVSALKGTGVKELLEGLLLLAEVRELRANPSRRARATVIESRQEKGCGTVATVLVQQGTLHVGDIFVAGAGFGRVRSMTDHNGNKVEAALPSVPVEITGFDYVPEAGDDFVVVESESVAREVSANRAAVRLAKAQRTMSGPISLEEFARRASTVAAEELYVILKADVHGSVEAVREAIEKLSTPKVKVKVLHGGVGGITESDVQLATASKAIVIGFGVRADQRAQQVAETNGIQLRFYRIIYELLEDVKKAMLGLLEPTREEMRLGRLEVRETFNVPKLGMVAGCFVSDGTVRRGAQVRLLRDSRVVYEGKMASLRRFKDDVREVQSGFECGLGIEGFNDIKVGDVVEVFEMREIAPTF